jgi:isoquinoline 1-oxidoreductase alpha subunit
MTKFVVNGKEFQTDDPGDMPLLWALRDRLKMHGTKYGCGIGACGACSVIIDGQAMRSCQIPISAVEGKSVTTIEGLAPAESPTAVQAAWIAEQVPQCGYCQSGQIMAAAALLEQNRTPTDADIDTAMRGNLCRCATYQRIRAAIHEAARQLAV